MGCLIFLVWAKIGLQGKTPLTLAVNGKSYKVGDAYYANKRQTLAWINVPGVRNYENQYYDYLGLEINTKLTVKGFDSSGKRALVECTPDPQAHLWINSFHKGTLLFYPLE